MPYKDYKNKLKRSKEYGKEYYARYKDRIGLRRRREKLKHRYGLSEQDFENLKESQNNCCIGCNKEVLLCVDHCHKTGEIRGLLCRTCNAAIGLAKEDVEILKNLVSYLERGKLNGKGKGSPSQA